MADKVKLDRETFLSALSAVKSGLAERELIEQSTCVVFQDGHLRTYNDDTSVSAPSGLPEGFSGAVAADLLLQTLQKVDGDVISVSCPGGEMVFQAGRTTAGFTMEAEVRLPVHVVDRPKKWVKLPEEFCDAVQLVQQCAGKDGTRFVMTCVHVTPEWIEASDELQACRWPMATGFSSPALLKRASVRDVQALGVTHVSETENWVHFRSPRGAVLSCRRFVEDYPSDDLTPVLSEKGRRVSLPKGLKDAAEAANVFSSQHSEDNLVRVVIRPNWAEVWGEGVTGWYRRKEPIHWEGDAVSFLISPQLLSEIVNRYNEVELTERVLRVDSVSYVYVACLEPAPEEAKEKKRGRPAKTVQA